MKFPFKSVVWLFIAALAAPAVTFGQGYPMPGSSTQAPVTCTTCNPPLPTYPYSTPIVKHKGRFLDSTRVRELQAPVRTFRAERIAIIPERDRVYMKFGSALVAYRLSTFFNQDLGRPLETMSGRGTGEQYLQYVGWIYPEKQGWTTVFQDGQERMGPGFDWDDRGYVYFPARIFGWGIVEDQGGNFTLLKQLGGPLGGPGSDVSPTGIVSFKHAGKYYAYVYDVSATTGALFDVTNASDPTYVKPLAHSIRDHARANVGGADVIAYADANSGEVKIYSAAGFIAGAGADRTFTPSPGLRFSAVDTDGIRFFAAEGAATSPGKFAVMTALGGTASSYTEDRFAIPGDRFSPSSITFSQDVVTTVGYGGGGNTLHMFRLSGAVPAYVEFNDYFKKYYSGTVEGGKQYAAPGFCNIVHDGIFYKDGPKEYVLYGANGLGDAYEIKATDGITIEREPTTGTPNPYSEGGAGPFYGDLFRFKTASTGAPMAIDVDYGNPEAASGNIASATTGQTLSYRYSGLASAAAIQSTRTVKIVAAGDATKNASAAVTMAVPTARVRGWRSTGVKDPALLFIQPNASATAPLVLGDSFVDASDGSVESHFSKWTLDAGAPVSLLPSEPFNVGQCGSHTLSFAAHYGAYENFTSRTASDYTRSLDNLNYAVAPFASRITTVASDASGLRFRPDIRVGTGAVTGGSGAAATITWVLLDAAGGQVRAPQVSSSTLADTVEFFVSSADLATAKSVRLTVALADPNLIVGAGCAGMASSSDTVQLIVPDPIVAVTTGCTNAGSPCTVTASSASGQNTSGWTYTWFLDNVQKATTNSNTYSPASADLAQARQYSVKVRVQNQAGIVNDSNPIGFTLQPALCGAIPDGVLSFTWAGLDGCVYPNCTSSSTIKFNPKAWGYTFQDCDTFSWNFGDGQTSNEKYPTHKFASDNTYSVILSVTNNQTTAPRQVAQAVKLGNSTPPPPPPPPDCGAPSQMVGFNMRGNTSGCTGLIGAADCATGEAISFTAVNFPESKAFQSCDTFSWDFGDGTNSNQRNPVKYYAAAGNYTVRMTVSNTSGSASADLPIKVVGGSTGPGPDPNCKLPDGSRMYLEYSAPSGCSNLPGSNPCNPGEVVTIHVRTLGSFQACDSFDWNFGDGTSTANTKTTTVTHQYQGTLPEYTITVTVKNTAGSTTVTEKVKIGVLGVEKPTSVDFTFGGTTPIIDVPITFTATATAPASYPVTSWQWNFGDGVTGTGNPVQHTFSTEGPWNVTLTASNAGGSAAPVTKTINVLKANAFTYLLPVVSHLNGANGSQWRTDLQIYNGNVGEGAVQLEFELPNKGLKKTFALSASTLILEDFMGFFNDGNWGGDWANGWAGPVIVRGAATHDLQIWTRTYSVGASGIGTYGHLIPAVRIDGNQSFTAGETILYMTGVNATPKYRTNIYLLNLTAQSMPVTITAYEGSMGAAVGQFLQSVAPFQLTPVSATQIVGAPADKPFSVAIQGTSNGLIAYESVVDNGSNDPIYIPAIATADLGEVAMKTQVVPSIGHFQSWRSDVTVFNPDDQAVQFDLAFYDSTGSLKAEAKDKILPAKGLLQLDDILRSEAMSIPEDVIGTLRLSVDSPLADHFPVVAQRNYSDSGDQKRFGQGVLGFAAADANVKAGKPAIIPAVRNDQLYKSNVGLINVGATDATIQLTLLDQATGQPVGIYSVTLKPNESRILPEAIPNVFMSTADRGSIKVEVTNDASVWAFAVIIDRSTSDPEYVPAIQLD